MLLIATLPLAAPSARRDPLLLDFLVAIVTSGTGPPCVRPMKEVEMASQIHFHCHPMETRKIQGQLASGKWVSLVPYRILVAYEQLAVLICALQVVALDVTTSLLLPHYCVLRSLLVLHSGDEEYLVSSTTSDLWMAAFLAAIESPYVCFCPPDVAWRRMS